MRQPPTTTYDTIVAVTIPGGYHSPSPWGCSGVRGHFINGVYKPWVAKDSASEAGTKITPHPNKDTVNVRVSLI